MPLVLNSSSITGLAAVDGFSSRQTGEVLQVVQGSTATFTSTTSTSYIATNLTASITPKFSTSKILALVSSCVTNVNAGVGNYTIYRNSTNLGGGSNSALGNYNASTTYYVWTPLIMSYLDSPSTTSSTTYTAYMSAGAGTTAYFALGYQLSTIILLEIAG